jgi:hypothetical protein
MAYVGNATVKSQGLLTQRISLILILAAAAAQSTPPFNGTNQSTTNPKPSSPNSTGTNQTSTAPTTNKTSSVNTTTSGQGQSSNDPISLTVRSKGRMVEYSYSSFLTANTNVEQYQIKGNFYDPLLYELNLSGVYFSLPSRTSQMSFAFQDTNCVFPMVCVTVGSRPVVTVVKNSLVTVTCDYSGASGILIRHSINLLIDTDNLQFHTAVEQWP